MKFRMERPLPADGQAHRISELWAWTAIDPLTDIEGVLALKHPQVMPLVFSVERLARLATPIAEAACRAAGEPRPVPRLRHFLPADD